MDDTSSRRVVQLIAGILVADDDLDPAEEAFIDRVLARFGMPEGARKTMFPIVDRAEAAAAMKKLPEEVRVYALKMLIHAAAVDGKVVASEMAYLEAIADAMGVSRSDLGAQIDQRLASLDD